MAVEEGSCGLLKGFILWRPWTSIHPFHDKLVCWTDLVGLSFPHVRAKRNVSFMKRYSSNKAFWFRKTNKLITCLFVYLFGRGQILPPSSSELPPEPPTLMAFLNSSSNFTLFRQYALVRNLSLSCQNSSLSFFSQCDLVCVCVSSQMYNLSDVQSATDFTLLLPTDDAIRQHLNRTNSSLLVGPDDGSQCCPAGPPLWSK